MSQRTAKHVADFIRRYGGRSQRRSEANRPQQKEPDRLQKTGLEVPLEEGS